MIENNECIEGDCFKLSEMNLPKAKLIIADPECGWEIEKHVKWISEAKKCLADNGLLIITGHPNQKLFKTDKKNSEFVIHGAGGMVNKIEDFGKNTWHESIKEAIKKYTSGNDLILDIFAGKGTAGFVAKSIGRSCISIEHNEEKVKIINEKLKLIKCEEDLTHELIFGKVKK